MPNSERTTVVVKTAGTSHKIFKLWFGSDGSYYVTVPYHSANKAVVFRATLNYAAGPIQEIPLSEMLDVASVDDDGRLKLSHHPDGFCQFSGHGILSGRDEAGRPKGAGVLARALSHVAPGPTFGIVFYGLQDFITCSDIRRDDIVFDADDLAPIPGCNGFRIEGYYLRPNLRAFVETDHLGSQWISIVHPTTAIVRLRVVLAPASCALPGLIGLHLTASECDEGESGFAITGPGGNLRDNAKGENVGDMITAAYPRPEHLPTMRELNYPSTVSN